jgi:alcohol dehydrogenase (cytochrome c)
MTSKDFGGGAAAFAGALAVLAACATPPSGPAPQPLPYPTSAWTTNGGDLYNRRFSPLTEIDRDNVADLKGVWRARLDGSGVGPQYSGEATPLYADGVLYVVTGADDVFAIDVDSGARLWKYEAQLDSGITTVCCGWLSRGVGMGEGKIFVGQLDGKLVALDQNTGAVVWSVQAERWQDGYTITSAPLYYDGLVITGFAGGERATRGRVKAYDAATGAHVWTFFTVPAPGEPGSETWPADSDIWMYGGATVWQTPAIDPELGMIYFSTGNPGPDFGGHVRAGDNLYTASVLALDVRTGEYRWHYQAVHHDIWDYDFPTPIVLADFPVRGRMRQGLIATGKTGWLYILDRVTGAPLIGIDERPVPQEPRQATAATQPYPRGEAFALQHVEIGPEGWELVNEGRIFTPFYGPVGVPIIPSVQGGASWPPSSYDPSTNLYYVCAVNSIGIFMTEEGELETPTSGDSFVGGSFQLSPMGASGVFAAMDVTTNTIAWRQAWADMCFSGSTATAGGLVFVGRNDGRFTALDSSNGRRLWEFQTGAGVNAPAIVFEHDGREHVAVFTGGNLFAGGAKGDSVWLFSLEGTLDPVAPAAPPPPPGAAAEAEAAAAAIAHEGVAGGTADVEAGLQVYTATCAFCHGADGRGGNGGGRPFSAGLSADTIGGIVADGRAQMPPFGGALGGEEIRDVSAYVAQVLLGSDR